MPVTNIRIKNECTNVKNTCNCEGYGNEWRRRGCIDIYWHRWKETLKHEVHRQVLAAMEGHTEE
jgi:hypothetical protein